MTVSMQVLQNTSSFAISGLDHPPPSHLPHSSQTNKLFITPSVSGAAISYCYWFNSNTLWYKSEFRLYHNWIGAGGYLWLWQAGRWLERRANSLTTESSWSGAWHLRARPGSPRKQSRSCERLQPVTRELKRICKKLQVVKTSSLDVTLNDLKSGRDETFFNLIRTRKASDPAITPTCC